MGSIPPAAGFELSERVFEVFDVVWCFLGRLPLLGGALLELVSDGGARVVMMSDRCVRHSCVCDAVEAWLWAAEGSGGTLVCSILRGVHRSSLAFLSSLSALLRLVHGGVCVG